MNTLNNILNVLVISAACVAGYFVWCDHSFRSSLRSAGWALNDRTGFSSVGLSDGLKFGVDSFLGPAGSVVLLLGVVIGFWLWNESRK